MATPYDNFRPELLTQGITSGINSLISGYMQAQQQKEDVLKQGKVAKSFLGLHAEQDPNLKKFLQKDPSENDYDYYQRLSSQAEGLMMNLAAQKQKQQIQADALQLQQQQEEAKRRAKVLQQYAAADNLSQGRGQGVYNPQMKQAASGLMQSPIGAQALDYYRMTGETPAAGTVGNWMTTAMSKQGGGGRSLEKVDTGAEVLMVDPASGQVVQRYPKGTSPNTISNIDRIIAEADAKYISEAQVTAETDRQKRLPDLLSRAQLAKTVIEDLKTGRISTGLGQDTITTIKKLGQRFGLDTNVSSEELLSAVATKKMIELQEQMKGATSDRDMKVNALAVASVDKSKAGNIRLLALDALRSEDEVAVARLESKLRNQGMNSGQIRKEVNSLLEEQAKRVPPMEAVNAFRDAVNRATDEAKKEAIRKAFGKQFGPYADIYGY